MESQSRVPRINVDLGEYSIQVEPVTPTRSAKSPDEYQAMPNSAYSPIAPPINRQKTTNRANKESRKLLAHILGQLERRQMPPIFLDFDEELASTGKGNSILDSVKGSANVKKLILESSKSFQQNNNEDEDADDDAPNDGSYSTDSVYELLVQLRDLILLSTAQGWHILDDGLESSELGPKSSSPFRRSRQSFHGQRPRSRSPSPSFGRETNIAAPTLLLTCIKIIASLVLEECRFKIASPRPSRPPNALQSVVLDLARILIHSNAHDPLITARIGFAIIPSFSTFPPEMHPRLVSFFRDVVIQGALDSLQQLQGLDDHTPVTSPARDVSSYSETPFVSIHVESATEDTYTDAGSDSYQGAFVHSTYASSQNPAIHRLSSLVAPALGTILDSVELDYGSLNNHASTLQFRRLLNILFDRKFDTCIDILQVIAHHTEKARRAAVSILLTNAPQIIGHRSVSLSRTGDTQTTQKTERPWSSRHQHQFTSWYFDPPDHRSRVGSCLMADCHTCSKPLSGFGLLCPFCFVAVHFYCFEDDEGHRAVQYASTAGKRVQRVAMFRFSNVLSARSAVTRDMHTFRTVNTFTLVLCFVCRLPLLGGTNQGMNCSACMLFSHHDCLSSLPKSHFPPCDAHRLNSDQITIEWTNLHGYFMDRYRPFLKMSDDDHLALSLEELSIIHASLQVQVQILANGLALGSLLITKGGRSYTPHEFEIHQAIRRLKKRLSFGDSPLSHSLQEYLTENNCEFSDHSLLFSWPILCYVSSQLRLPSSPGPPLNSPDLLTVAQPPPLTLDSLKPSSQPFDVVPISHIHSVLRRRFNIRSDGVADLYVKHLIHCGFISQLKEQEAHRSRPSAVFFPLPHGLDTSSTVETLVSTIEACLADNDLCANELGFLLLVRRSWPDGLTPEYIIVRLLRALISWILSEDNNLAAVLSDRLAKQKVALRGQAALSQPAAATSEGIAIGSNDYLTMRRMLLGRYATPWLRTLCDYDKQNFSEMVFSSCSAIVKRSDYASLMDGDTKHLVASHVDSILRAISRLNRIPVLDSVINDLVDQWLQLVADSSLSDEPLASVPRLFARETDIEQLQQTSNPWNTLIRHARESREGLGRSLEWLHLIAYSKADLPPPLLTILVEVVSSYDANLTEALTLVKTVLVAAWSSVTPRLAIQATVTELSTCMSPSVISNITSGVSAEESMLFIRLCFSAYLSAAGCERTRLFEVGLVEQEEFNTSSAFRKEGGRNTAPEDPLVISKELLEVVSQYLRLKDTTITCLVLKFLAVFLLDSPSLESHEADNFLLRNGTLVATCLWEVYDLQDQTLCTIRPQLLIRTFSVDSGPFETLLRGACHPTAHWEQRLSAANRLFLVVLDLGNMVVAEQQDASCYHSIAEAFQIFFSLMWSDPNEEIRASIEAMSASLLPAHFDAISFYWDDYLLNIPSTSKESFVNFLSHLQAYIPLKKLISWKGIIGTLDSLAQEEIDDSEDAPEANQAARVSILCFAFQMAANGTEIDGQELLQLKYHFLHVLGFKDVAIVPLQNKHGFRVQFGELQELVGAALPCLHPFVRLLDSARVVDLASAVVANTNLQDEKHVTILIGSPFIDVFLNVFCNLRDWTALPFPSLKQTVEGLLVTVSKHDFESRPLRHLQQLLRRAISKAIELLSEEINQDLRQIILSTVQTFVKQCSSFMGSILYTSIESAVQLAVLRGSNSSDVLTIQATSYIQEILSTYAQHGIFTNLFKRTLGTDFFDVIGEILNQGTGKGVELHEALLRDVLSRVVESDQSEAQLMLKNLQMYVEKVFYLDMSGQLANYVGHQLSQLARRAIEWEMSTADCNPILDVMAILISKNKSIARNFLYNTETILRILLHRSHLKKESLLHLLKEAPTVPKQTGEQAWVGPIQLVSEILLDALRLKSRVPSPTIAAIIEAFSDPSLWPKGGQPLTRTPDMVEAGVYYLQGYNWFSSNTTDDFASSFAISKEVWSALLKEPREIVNLFDRCAERLSHTKATVRAWNTILMAVLSDTHPQQQMAYLLDQLPSFSGAHHRGMQAYLGGQGWGGPDFSLVDLNHGYIAIKLWVLLALRASTADNDGEARILAVWNELWPPFENLIRVLESQSQMNQNMTFTTLLISSIADLFIFLRGLKTPIGLNTSNQIAVLNRLQNLGVETTSQKLNRAFKYMSDTPPEVPQEVIMDQIAKDIIAAERLRLIESKVQGMGVERRLPERQRREYRIASTAG